MENTIKFLKEKKGYTEYKSAIEYFQTHLQKRIESKSVCETNDKLCINIKMSSYDHNNTVHEGYQISITAEKNSKWWNFECYSLNREELIDQIDELEAKLVEIFNLL